MQQYNWKNQLFQESMMTVDSLLQKLFDVANPGFNFGGRIRHITHATREQSEMIGDNKFSIFCPWFLVWRLEMYGWKDDISLSPEKHYYIWKTVSMREPHGI